MWNLKGALSGDRPASQYGVLAGLRVTLHYGLVAPMNSRPLCPRRRDTVPRFMTTRVGRRPVRHYTTPSVRRDYERAVQLSS
jgi:hypothetical protein